MKLLKKRQTIINPRQEELAGRIAGSIIRRQTQLADYLNGRTRYVSGQTKLIWLIVFCVLFAAINSYLLIHSMTH